MRRQPTAVKSQAYESGMSPLGNARDRFSVKFYLVAMLFGMQIAQSVVAEKESRVVEILAAAIPLRHLLAGKVLGNTALAMIQLLIYLAVGLVGLSFTPYKSYVPALTGPTAWFIGFFFACGPSRGRWPRAPRTSRRPPRR